MRLGLARAVAPAIVAALCFSGLIASSRGAAQDLVPPRLLEAPEVTLPEGAEPLPEGTAAELLITVDAAGAVSAVELVAPVRADVDPLVIEAARGMRFEPARENGVAIPARIRFRFAVRTGGAGGETEAETETETETEAETVTETESEAAVAVAEEEVLSFGARAVARPEPGAATRVTLQAEELTTVPGTFGEPLRVVATMPGVARTPFGLGYFLVRGASFENTGFLVDGFPVPILYHLGAGPAVLSSRLVTRLDFYPGGYPVRYGRFAAGVISLETGAPDVERVHLEAEIDFFRASALAIVPLPGDRGVVSAAFRRSYYDLILPLLVEGIDLAYTDWQVRADVKLGPRLTGSLFLFGSDDVLDSQDAVAGGVADENASTSFGYAFERAVARLELRLPEARRLIWAGTIGFDHTFLRRVDPGGLEISTTIEGTYLGQRLELVSPWNEILSTSVGADVSAVLYQARSQFPVPPGFGEIPRPVPNFTTSAIALDPIVLSAAAYVEQIVRLGPFELVPGLRMDHMQYADVSTVLFDPRGVVRWRINEMVTAKAATGLFAQPPQPFQIDREFANPRLRPIRSWQSSGGVELRLPEQIEVESQLYYTRMYQIARTTPALVPDGEGGVRRQIYEDDGQGRSYGWELLVRRKVEEGLYGWLSYTLAWSERFLENGDPIPYIFDQRHTLNVAASYAWNGWRFGARFTLSSGRPERPVLSAVYDADGDRYRANRGRLGGELAIYHQLDVRVDRDLRIGPLTGSVYLDVINVYWAQNEEGRYYQFDFGQSAPLPGLPILGTLGLRLEYE